MSLKQKIIALVGLPILSLAVIIGYGSWSITGVSNDLDSLVNDQFVVLMDEEITPLIQEDMLPLINEDIARIQDLHGSMELMLEADRDLHQAVIAEKLSLVASEENEITAADKTNKENIEQARERMRKASEYFTSLNAKSTYQDFLSAFAEWEKQTRKVIEMSNSPERLVFARKLSEGGSAQVSFNFMRDLVDQLQGIQQAEVETEMSKIALKRDRVNERDKLVRERRDFVLASAEQTEEDVAATVPMFLGIGIIVAVLISFVGLFAARSITRPLSRLSDVAVNVSNGDVQQEIDIDSKDETGVLANAFRYLIDYMKGLSSAAESIATKDLRVEINPKSEKDVLGHPFQTMASNLSSMIRQIGDNADQLVTASTEIASTSEEMARGANDQSDRITQISTAVEEMTAAINESSKNSNDASEASRAASETAGQGGRIIHDIWTVCSESRVW